MSAAVASRRCPLVFSPGCKCSRLILVSPARSHLLSPNSPRVFVSVIVPAMEDPAPAEDPHYDVDLGPEVDAANRVQKIPSAKAKKRASRACLPCRSRKVRCILTSSAEPCINCRLDEKECIFIARSKFSYVESWPLRYLANCRRRGTSRHAPVAVRDDSSTAPPADDFNVFGDDLPGDEQSLVVDPVSLDATLPSLPHDLGSYGK